MTLLERTAWVLQDLEKRGHEALLAFEVGSTRTGEDMAASEYNCGTCGSASLVATVEETFPTLHGPKWAWKLMCGNGHELIPVPGTEIVIEAIVGARTHHLYVCRVMANRFSRQVANDGASRTMTVTTNNNRRETGN